MALVQVSEHIADDRIRDMFVRVSETIASRGGSTLLMMEAAHGTIFFSSATAAFRGSSLYPHYVIGKFGLRALSQRLAKAYSMYGVLIVHMRVDCNLDVPLMQALHPHTET